MDPNEQQQLYQQWAQDATKLYQTSLSASAELYRQGQIDLIKKLLHDIDLQQADGYSKVQMFRLIRINGGDGRGIIKSDSSIQDNKKRSRMFNIQP